ncbi:hypothetical protein H5410_052166 [Solanum commersonii]|uniref:Uncharacterized protein n=1 Tax=Solanum commersonii TaxID=4109 RepID=A0A9J5X0E1_SOLCO|nr:hypothetical protein H5410_052166 [Solanum commersonii]
MPYGCDVLVSKACVRDIDSLGFFLYLLRYNLDPLLEILTPSARIRHAVDGIFKKSEQHRQSLIAVTHFLIAEIFGFPSSVYRVPTVVFSTC